MNKFKIQPVILCGGKGTRLWPLSRESFPKQYLSISTESNKSMLQETYKRIENLENLVEPIIMCNEEHRFIVAEQFREIAVDTKAIILEPLVKNTAPAICLSALKAIEDGSDPLLLILSSDHHIKNQSNFREVIINGVEHALKGNLVVFGVVPDSAETGYGYIKSNEKLNKDKNSFGTIDKFIEKPTHFKAEEYFKDRRYLWNSGIFLFKASSILNEINKYHPEIIESCRQSLNEKIDDLDFQRIKKSTFKKCPNISIDYAVMEKTKLGLVLPLNVGWSDIGSWQSLWKSELKDNEGNVISGNVLNKNSANCYIRSENKLLVTLGLDDLVIVQTSDATLVSKKNCSEEVKKIVEHLNNNEIKEGSIHKKIFRPWGHFISIEDGLTWHIKKLTVNPFSSLSLQMHNHRSEHWIIVSGKAYIEIDQKVSYLSQNQSIYIPVKSKHRLSNKEKYPLVIIEIQSGSYLGEDDIIRFEDNYGRNINNVNNST